jgi:formate/nitrite transporter FocA (FNT family)
MVVARSRWPSTSGPGLVLLLAFAYSIGFLIVILGRSELFTEHTTLAVLPLLSRQTSIARVGRLWGLVYAGNLAGATLFAWLAVGLATSRGLFSAAAIRETAEGLTAVGAWPMFGSAVAAGWLMGLVSWLVTAARETVAQILIIVIVTGAIAFLGLHHSIAGSIEVLFAVCAGQLPWQAWLRFLAISTLGNIVGGTILVAILKFGHVTHDRPE